MQHTHPSDSRASRVVEPVRWSALVTSLATVSLAAGVAHAQAGDAPSLAGSVPPPSAPANATTGAPGSPTGNGVPQQPGGNYMFLIVMGGFLVLWIVMITMGQRREAKKRQTLFDSLKKHDRVQTTGGVIGTIVEIKPETIVLRVDENSGTKITFARAAIVGVVKDAGSAEPAKS
jgi:preprotein translocase subunit YajC